MVLVVVEGRHAVGSGEAIGTSTSNFRALLALVPREHAPAAAEERVGGDVDLRVETDALA